MSKNESIREHLINEIATIIRGSVKLDDWSHSDDLEEVARRILNHIEAKGGELK